MGSSLLGDRFHRDFSLTSGFDFEVIRRPPIPQLTSNSQRHGIVGTYIAGDTLFFNDVTSQSVSFMTTIEAWEVNHDYVHYIISIGDNTAPMRSFALTQRIRYFILPLIAHVVNRMQGADRIRFVDQASTFITFSNMTKHLFANQLRQIESTPDFHLITEPIIKPAASVSPVVLAQTQQVKKKLHFWMSSETNKNPYATVPAPTAPGSSVVTIKELPINLPPPASVITPIIEATPPLTQPLPSARTPDEIDWATISFTEYAMIFPRASFNQYIYNTENFKKYEAYKKKK